VAALPFFFQAENPLGGGGEVLRVGVLSVPQEDGLPIFSPRIMGSDFLFDRTGRTLLLSQVFRKAGSSRRRLVPFFGFSEDNDPFFGCSPPFFYFGVSRTFRVAKILGAATWSRSTSCSLLFFFFGFFFTPASCSPSLGLARKSTLPFLPGKRGALRAELFPFGAFPTVVPVFGWVRLSPFLSGPFFSCLEEGWFLARRVNPPSAIPSPQ